MLKNQKKKVGIWFGGCSSEYQVSLQSAYAVITHMDKQVYEPVLIGISRDGDWFLYQGDVERIKEDTWMQQEAKAPVTLSMDRRIHGLLVMEGSHIREDSHIREGSHIRELSLDVAFPVLHGKNGEDGTLQGALELAGIPVAGCKTLSSAACMDKDMAHRIVEAAGVKVPKSRMFHKREVVEEKKEDFYRERGREIGFPLFVKPVRAGSSLGITKVTEPEQLNEAVELAFEYDEFCIMEEAIEGFEVGCAVLGEKELTIGEVDEIQLSLGFFDYEEKYSLKTSQIHVPARIPAKKAEEIKKTAGKIYHALACSGFARVDMFLTGEGDIYFNEVNTIPGFTSHSRYPNMMKAAGISFPELIGRIIESA